MIEDGGLIFEATPNINITHSASYNPISLPHSNYDYHSYSKSAIQDITLDADFYARDIHSADKLLAIMHFLRTFSKMNFGIYDSNKGMPPQIFRFSAYGQYMFQNVPVTIRNVSLPLTNDVDYIMTNHDTAVPVHIRITIMLLVMPTPNKIRTEFTLNKFATGELVKKGYI